MFLSIRGQECNARGSLRLLAQDAVEALSTSFISRRQRSKSASTSALNAKRYYVQTICLRTSSSLLVDGEEVLCTDDLFTDFSSLVVQLSSSMLLLSVLIARKNVLAF